MLGALAPQRRRATHFGGSLEPPAQLSTAPWVWAAAAQTSFSSSEQVLTTEEGSTLHPASRAVARLPSATREGSKPPGGRTLTQVGLREEVGYRSAVEPLE